MSEANNLKVRITCRRDDKSVYNVNGLQVVFAPWYSEYQKEHFTSVSVIRGGCEVFNAAFTHLQPSEEQAREIVETMAMLQEALKVEL